MTRPSIIQIVQDSVKDTWDYCQSVFDIYGRVKYHAFSKEAIEELLSEGNASLYVVSVAAEIKGACVACVDQNHGKKTLFIPIMGGVDFADWYHELADCLEKVAVANDCSTIEYIGRGGFSKLDPSYKEDCRLYIKELK